MMSDEEGFYILAELKRLREALQQARDENDRLKDRAVRAEETIKFLRDNLEI